MAERKPVFALVTDAIAPYHRGGKEMRYHELAPRLAAHADVHVYTMKWWSGPRVVRRGDVTYHAISPRLALYTADRRSVVQAVVFALACLRLLFARFDVLEADHMPYFQLFTLKLVAVLRRKPFVATWHEVWGPAYWRDYLGRPGVVGWWTERAAMRLPDGIVAASQETARRLREHVGQATPVIAAPNGIDLGRVDAVAAAAGRVEIVAVGRLLSHKRVDLVLDAVALLRAGGQDVRCRVIGDGPERAALAEHARARGISDAVELLHDVEGHDALYALVKAADVFVSASEREGFGIAVLEAIACGVPVVTTSAPDNLASELVRQSGAGVVVEPESAAIAGGIRTLLATASGAEVARAERAWIERYDWDVVAGEVGTWMRGLGTATLVPQQAGGR
jgi:glycosyltransferase involved in cell wall biosynthesis